MVPLTQEILLDFWRDEGGLKGCKCCLRQLPGLDRKSEIDCAWEYEFGSSSYWPKDIGRW
jgi:hypothetical protein